MEAAEVPPEAVAVEVIAVGEEAASVVAGVVVIEDAVSISNHQK